jgi:hypothetical protein
MSRPSHPSWLDCYKIFICDKCLQNENDKFQKSLSRPSIIDARGHYWAAARRLRSPALKGMTALMFDTERERNSNLIWTNQREDRWICGVPNGGHDNLCLVRCECNSVCGSQSKFLRDISSPSSASKSNQSRKQPEAGGVLNVWDQK